MSSVRDWSNAHMAIPSPTRGEFIADGVVQVLGLCLGLVGAVILITTVAADGSAPKITAAAIYAGGLVAMLGCSATYNLMPGSRYRAVLRRLDHCGIFLMIAGTYTPFTTLHLYGAWAFGLTAFVWNAALLGVGAKLLIERALEGLSVGIYLALGWVGVIATGPFLASLRPLTLLLLAAGGLLYSIGVIFHVWETLPFQKALWHAFVLAGAGLHYAAVLDGIGIA
jgi:hemolysin III